MNSSYNFLLQFPDFEIICIPVFKLTQIVKVCAVFACESEIGEIKDAKRDETTMRDFHFILDFEYMGQRVEKVNLNLVKLLNDDPKRPHM